MKQWTAKGFGKVIRVRSMNQWSAAPLMELKEEEAIGAVYRVGPEANAMGENKIETFCHNKTYLSLGVNRLEHRDVRTHAIGAGAAHIRGLGEIC